MKAHGLGAMRLRVASRCRLRMRALTSGLPSLSLTSWRTSSLVMPSFSTSKTVTEHLDQLYAYLKGRADGAIKKAKVEPIR